MITNPKLYNTLKAFAQIWLPALGTLYFALAGIWGLPAAEQVVGTIVSVDTFLGIVLGISTNKYNAENIAEGILKVEETEETKKFHLEFDEDPEYELEGKTEARFKVEKKPLASASRHRTGKRRK
jgi:hypothetical protein